MYVGFLVHKPNRVPGTLFALHSGPVSEISEDRTILTVCFIRMCGSTTALRGNTAALRHQPNRVPGTLFALHSGHVFPNGVRNTLSVTIRVNIIVILGDGFAEENLTKRGIKI